MVGGKELCGKWHWCVQSWRPGEGWYRRLPRMESLISLHCLAFQVQSMKQTNSSLRQALEGGIDPLRPPEVRLLLSWGAGRGPLWRGSGKGRAAWRAAPPFLCL